MFKAIIAVGLIGAVVGQYLEKRRSKWNRYVFWAWFFLLLTLVVAQFVITGKNGD